MAVCDVELLADVESRSDLLPDKHGIYTLPVVRRFSLDHARIYLV